MGDAYLNMVKQFAREGETFACVIDSYNWEEAIDLWTIPQKGQTKSLTDMVADFPGAVVVLRPDSGHPVVTPVQVVEKLISRRRATNNSKGYLVLPDYVRRQI